MTELGRVLQQIPDCLRQAIPVPIDEHRLPRRRELEAHAVRLEHRAVVLDDAAGEVVQVEAPAPQVDLAVRDARDVQEVTHEASHVADLATDDAHGVPRGGADARGAAGRAQPNSSECEPSRTSWSLMSSGLR
jgi:hypothetical protein